MTRVDWPRPWDSERGWQQFTHQDLPTLDAEALWRARRWAERALEQLTPRESDKILEATGPVVTAGDWLRGRLAHLTREEMHRDWMR